GARDLDPPEAALLQGSAITAIPVSQIPEGLSGLLARAPLADTLGYLHLDVDVLDPTVGHGNYLPAPQRPLPSPPDRRHSRSPRSGSARRRRAHLLFARRRPRSRCL